MTDITLTEFIPGGKVKAQEINDNFETLKEAIESKVEASDASVTKQGNTFNSANQLVKLNSSGQIPAIDGGLITNIKGTAIDALGTMASNFTLAADKITTANVTSSCVLSLPTLTDSTREVKCIFDFTTSNASYPTLPTGVLKKDGKPLTFSALSGVRNRLIFTTVNGGITWEAELSLYGGVETPYVVPTLSANGTLGGSSFAVHTTGEQSGYEFYKGFDGNSNTFFESMYFPIAKILYFPVPVRLTNLSFLNSSYTGNCFPPKAFTLYGSNDNTTYTTIGSYTNTVYTLGSTGNVSISITDFYKYYKLVVTSAWNYSGVEQTSYIEVITIGITGYYISTS